MADPITPAPEAPYNPVERNQNWQNEYGFIDSFTPQAPASTQALQRGVIGLGAGGAAAGLTGRNPWLTGVNTGIGASAGHLLTHLLTKGMSNQGDAAAINTLGALAGAGGGFGLSQFMQDKRKKNMEIPLPLGASIGIRTKQASFVGDVVGQLPNIRLPDSVVGGALGAGGGLIYDAVKDDGKVSPAEARRRRWSRALGGAGIGALGTNLVGDRFRRYVSNKILPFGYGQSAEGLTLKPKNFKEVWDGAVMDRPLQEPVKDFMAGKIKEPYTPDDRLPFNSSANELVARRELLRRGFGVHTENPKTDIWKRQGDGSVSLNPQQPHAETFVKEFMYPQSNYDQMKLLTDPLNATASINSGTQSQPQGLMSYITGGQRIASYPYRGTSYDNPDQLLKMQDRWDFGLDSREREAFMKYLKDRYIKRDPKALLDWGENYQTQDPKVKPPVLPNGTNATVLPGMPSLEQRLASDARASSAWKRLAMEHILMKEAPWVSQRAYMQKLPSSAANYSSNTGYAMIPTTAGGQTYPGKTIATHNPVSVANPEFHDPKDIMARLSTNNYIPRVPDPPKPPVGGVDDDE